MTPTQAAKDLVYRFEHESAALHRIQRDWLVKEIAALITAQVGGPEAAKTLKLLCEEITDMEGREGMTDAQFIEQVIALAQSAKPKATAQVGELKPSALWARSEYLDTVEANKREALETEQEKEIDALIVAAQVGEPFGHIVLLNGDRAETAQVGPPQHSVDFLEGVAEGKAAIAATIERCAQVVEKWMSRGVWESEKIVTAIRKLKDEP